MTCLALLQVFLWEGLFCKKLQIYVLADYHCTIMSLMSDSFRATIWMALLPDARHGHSLAAPRMWACVLCASRHPLPQNMRLLQPRR